MNQIFAASSIARDCVETVFPFRETHRYVTFPANMKTL